MEKVLVIDHEKCTGCRLCELVCSVKHEGVSNPSRARIKIVKWEMEGKMIPVTCQQCDDAPCMAVCPVQAISRNVSTGVVQVDYDTCIGCRVCMSACPFGAMGFDWVQNHVIKCDLCGGDPQCANFCETGAIQFVEKSSLNSLKQRKSAAAIIEVMSKPSTVFSEVG